MPFIERLSFPVRAPKRQLAISISFSLTLVTKRNSFWIIAMSREQGSLKQFVSLIHSVLYQRFHSIRAEILVPMSYHRSSSRRLSPMDQQSRG